MLTLHASVKKLNLNLYSYQLCGLNLKRFKIIFITVMSVLFLPILKRKCFK